MDTMPYTAPLTPFDNALVDAVEESDAEGVELALSLGANSNVFSHAPNKMPLTHRAALRGDLAVLRLLVDAGAPWAAFPGMPGHQLIHMAARGDNPELLAYVIERLRQKVDEEDSFGQTPLFIAALGACLHTAEELLRRGADVNAKCKTNGETPLMIALQFDYDEETRAIEVIRLFLAHGADPTLKNDSGRTPLDELEENLALLLNSQSPENWSYAEKLRAVFNPARE